MYDSKNKMHDCCKTFQEKKVQFFLAQIEKNRLKKE